jgi:hypothetical protein
VVYDPPVARRSALLVPVLLAVLALLAPMAVVADPCPDCRGPFQGCCPSQGCPCCLPGSSILTAEVRVDLGLASTGLAGEPPADRCLTADSPDIFHVPKLHLA